MIFVFSAPKLQGRPRKKKRRPDSESESSETSEDQKPRLLKGKPSLMPKSSHSLMRGMMKSNSIIPPSKVKESSSMSHHHHYHHHHHHHSSNKNDFSTPALDRLIEVDFMSKLYKYMKDRNTPIKMIPTIGNKQCKLVCFYSKLVLSFISFIKLSLYYPPSFYSCYRMQYYVSIR